MEQPSANELVLAICHEANNLLAALRLGASLGGGSEGVAELAARAGGLLALVRPLLAPEAKPPPPADPLDLLGDLRAQLDDCGDSRVRVELRSAARLPLMAADAGALRPLLLVEVLAALADTAADERLRVAAERSGANVRLVIEGGAAARSGGKLAGRALTRALARALLVGGGGGLLEEGNRPTRTVYELPALRRPD